MRITFIGTGDAMGTPRVYCDCDVCGEARTTGANRRMRSSLWLEEEGEPPLLLDCGPDWGRQMELLGARGVGQAIVTHAHFDHIGGLPEWCDACRWQDRTARLFAPAEVLAETRQRFPWLESRLTMVPNDAGMRYGPWTVRPWRVHHGHNGYSYAYRFEREHSGSAWAYCSDAIGLSEREKAPMKGLKLLVLGTSFAHEPFPMDTRSVYDMREGVELVAELVPEAAVFTHLSHDVDVRRDYGLPPGIRLATAPLTLHVD